MSDPRASLPTRPLLVGYLLVLVLWLVLAVALSEPSYRETALTELVADLSADRAQDARYDEEAGRVAWFVDGAERRASASGDLVAGLRAEGASIEDGRVGPSRAQVARHAAVGFGLFLLFVGVPLALAADALTIEQPQPRTIWTLVTVLFGPAGVVAYLATRPRVGRRVVIALPMVAVVALGIGALFALPDLRSSGGSVTSDAPAATTPVASPTAH